MKKYVIYFMPDISGFTNFVTSTEIEHSKHIISELLEILIDSNYIGLKLVEIEGDALFMYTTELPEFSNLVAQSKKMLNAFSEHVHLYNTNRICDCGACATAQDLQIKFLAHYGEISFMRVKNIVKPYGIDVIKIHRLLKNSIPSNQYLLISQGTLDFYKNRQNVISKLSFNQDEYDYGTLQYAYTELEPLIKPNENDIKRTIKPNRKPEISLEIDITNDIDKSINYISNLSHKTEWFKLINSLDFDDLRINQAGTVHQCIIGDNRFNVETIKWELEDNERGYGEQTFDMPNIDLYQYFITLQQKEHRIHLSLEVFIDFNKALQEQDQSLNFLKESWEQSLSELKLRLNSPLN